MNVQKLTKAYYYLFYKLYKWIGEENGWADWKAGIAVMTFEIWFVLSLFNYYNTLIDKNFDPNNTLFITVGVIIISINVYLFTYLDHWKNRIKEFDKLPDRTNNIGGAIVFVVLLFIIGNLIFSFYLMSQVDWAQYR